jgi:hypothetical protein
MKNAVLQKSWVPVVCKRPIGQSQQNHSKKKISSNILFHFDDNMILEVCINFSFLLLRN